MGVREPLIYEGPATDLCGRPAPTLLWVGVEGWQAWDGVTAFLSKDPTVYDHVFVATRFLRRPQGGSR